VNIENENTQPATRETMPEYLDRLAADQIEAGLDATGADIKAAAAEIRKLQVEIGRMANAQAYAADREAQLSAAIFGLIEDHVQTFVENEVQTAIDDYDPTDHYNFSDAVAEQTADPSTESIREAVADVIKNGYFDVTFRS
jgi:hypothetical protein